METRTPYGPNRAVKIGVTDPETRHIIIEYVAYENANIECKRILMSLKIISAPMSYIQ